MNYLLVKSPSPQGLCFAPRPSLHPSYPFRTSTPGMPGCVLVASWHKSFKEKFFDLFSNKKNKLSDESCVFDNVREYFNYYSDFLQNLSLEQQIILFNFLCSILLLSYIVSILIIFYSNYLIERFDLEKRYPRIAVYLRYRAKFQKYYILPSWGEYHMHYDYFNCHAFD